MNSSMRKIYKKNSKKALNVIVLIVISLVALFLETVICTYSAHYIKTNREIEMLKANGYYNPVSVGDYSLNVAMFGNENGKHTIVSLSGLGKGDCSVTERRMVSCLEEENRVIFIDRAGYGLSDDTRNEMTIDYIVEDYRKALKNAGVEAPYVLMPSSISGAYATYWTSKYPQEIEAVVFLDGTQLSQEMRLPENNVGFKDRVEVFLSQVGMDRVFLRDTFELYADGFSSDEQLHGDVLNLMTTDSYAMVSEIALRDQNLRKAWDNIVTTDVPKMYICSSWGFKTADEVTEHGQWVNDKILKNNLDMPLRPTEYEGNEDYIDTLISACDDAVSTRLIPYLDRLGNCSIVMLGGDHTIYEHKPDDCGLIIKEYIDNL